MGNFSQDKGTNSKKLVICLFAQGYKIFESEFDESLHCGRRKSNEPDSPKIQRANTGELRFLVAPLTETAIPRNLLQIVPNLENGSSVCIINTHEDRTITIDDFGVLGPKGSQTVNLPAGINLQCGYRLEIQAKKVLPTHFPSPTSRSFLSGNRHSESIVRNQTISNLLGSNDRDSGLDAETVLNWLNEAVRAMQRPASDPDYFSGFAKAATEIADFDRAEVVLWTDNRWERDESRMYVRAETGQLRQVNPPSNSLLEKARINRRPIMHPETGLIQQISETNSVSLLVSAIAFPLLDESKKVLGVLYADRGIGNEPSVKKVTEAEQKLIEILASGITSGILKSKQEKLVVKYQQFFSPKITEAIRQNPSLLDGENTEVTVLFCDIRGFSRTADLIGPAQAMKWVSDTLSELSGIVLDSDGVLIDYVGDEMFAMWGAPEKSEAYSFKAACAAMQMIERREAISKRWKSIIPEGVDFGIGLCTGPARVGNTGSNQKFKYGPMGRTVNLGSRIQGLTKQWKANILMDEATQESLPDDILRRRLCKASVVGLEGAIDIYELLLDNCQSNLDLIHGYEAACRLYETGINQREAVRAFGDLVQRFPQDGPSLIMLVRAVNQLVDPVLPFSPIWSASSK